MSGHRVAVIIGSLRRESLNRRVANVIIEIAQPRLACEVVEIRDLPLYDQDLEAAPPEAWVRFRERIRAVDALLFVTPEYNRSVPGALKNALDVGSRPYGKSAWASKPAAIVSVSPGALGAFGANHHLRQSLVFLDVPAMQQPEAYIGNAAALFDDAGALKADTRQFLAEFVDAFSEWIDHTRRS